MEVKDYQDKSNLIIDKLDLEEYQKDLIRQNWLDFILYLEKKIHKNYSSYKFLSTLGIIGGISIPALSSLTLIPEPFSKLSVSILGVVTAASIAVNQNQKNNEKWRHFRKMVEYARIEGENFLSLAGQDYKGKTHKEGFGIFVKRLSNIKEMEIKTFFDSIDGVNKNKQD